MMMEATAHGADEHLSLEDLRKATEVVAVTPLNLLGTEGWPNPA